MAITGRTDDEMQTNFITEPRTQDDSWPQDDEAVRILAYNLWERRGSPLGSPEDDWLEAERQLRGMQRANEETPPAAAQAS
jgi:hypothetical protein